MSEINITHLPATLSHTVYQGDVFAHTLTIKEDGELVDITGDSFTFLAVDARGEVVISLAIGTGITIIGTGEVQWEFSEAETDAMPTDCPIKYAFRWATRGKTIEIGKIVVIAKLQ